MQSFAAETVRDISKDQLDSCQGGAIDRNPACDSCRNKSSIWPSHAATWLRSFTRSRFTPEEDESAA
ncbi:hypothetical protein FOVSG1_014801 [Fusarium oxysporum f. sp. vasinfectum]